MSKYLLLLTALLGSAFWFFSSQAAATKAEQNLTNLSSTHSPVVVELFTSQGCSSCPPADRVIAELATSHGDRVLPLSFHVDYWNYIGWSDPFSSAQVTQRQRHYRSTFGRNNIYTPQAVIGGSAQMNGGARTKVFNTISQQAANQNGPKIQLQRQGSKLNVNVASGQGSARIILVEYDPEHTTKILRGENRGETLTNYNVVRNFSDIGEWNGEAKTLNTSIGNHKGIAVLVQSKPQGRILSAARL